MTEREMKRKAAARRARARKARNRRVALTICLMLAVSLVSIGGTIAWLQDVEDPVINTFTPSDIGITLTETPNTDKDNDGDPDVWEVQLIPGVEYEKNPTVAVVDDKTDVPIYLFVEVDEGNCETYLDYTLAWDYVPTGEDDPKADKYAGWTELTGEGVTAGTVYYRVVEDDDPVQTWDLLVDNKVTVKDTVVKTGSTSADGIEMPTANQQMIFKAYAIQYQQFETDVLGAWNQAKTTA